MKEKPIREKITRAILAELVDRSMTPEEGIGEIMSAVCCILGNAGELLGYDRRTFIGLTFKQCMEQI